MNILMRVLGKVILPMIFTFLNITGATTQQPKENLQLSIEQWKEDIEFIKTELPKKHKNAFHTITKERFEAEIELLKSELPQLSNDAIIVEMVRVVSLIGDAHTFLRYPKSFKWFPIRFYQFGNEIRVIRTIDQYQNLLGTKLIKVGDTTIYIN
jgi:hypothetical protein